LSQLFEIFNAFNLNEYNHIERWNRRYLQRINRKKWVHADLGMADRPLFKLSKASLTRLEVDSFQSTILSKNWPRKLRYEPHVLSLPLVLVVCVVFLQAILVSNGQKCSRKIWNCAGDRGGRQAKKARTSEVKSSATEQASLEEQMPVNRGGKSHPLRQESEGLETFLNALTYRDMQLQCKEYGLMATGNKEILRERLLEYLLENKDGRASDYLAKSPQRENKREDNMVESGDIQSLRTIEPTGDDDAKMEEVTSSLENVMTSMEVEEFAKPRDAEPIRISGSSNTIQSDQCASELSSKENDMDVDQAPMDPPGKIIPEHTSSVAFGGVSEAKSPLRSYVKDAVKHMSHSAQKARLMEHISTPGDHLSPPPSDFSASTSCSKISGTRVREIVSKLTTNQTSSTLSNKLQASKDARMARLAEMRGKVGFLEVCGSSLMLPSKYNFSPMISFSLKAQITKAITASSSTSKHDPSSKEYSSALTSLNAKSAPSTNPAKNLAAQMREKALRKDTNPNLVVAPVHVGSVAKPSIALKNTSAADPLGSTLKSLKTYSVKKKPKSPPRPSQTYEISDREDSDSDDSEDEDGKRKKELPKWVAKENLRPALHAQYIGKTLDPDEIFGEVHTCDLEAIFGNQMKSKYRNRTSSGNWSQDRVTAAEKLVYKRAMGFADET
jgi:Inner centromere protein, ARK binding region